MTKNNKLQNSSQKPKDREMRTPLQLGGVLEFWKR